MEAPQYETESPDRNTQLRIKKFIIYAHYQSHQERTWIISAMAFIMNAIVSIIFSNLPQNNQLCSTSLEFVSKIAVIIGSFALLAKVFYSKSRNKRILKSFQRNPIEFNWASFTKFWEKYLNLVIFILFAMSTFSHLVHIMLKLTFCVDHDHDLNDLYDPNILSSPNLINSWDRSLLFRKNDNFDTFWALNSISTLYQMSIGGEVNEQLFFKSLSLRIKLVLFTSLMIAFINFIYYFNDMFYSYNNTNFLIFFILKNIIYIIIYGILSIWCCYLLLYFIMRKKTFSYILMNKYPTISSIIVIFAFIVVICSLQYFSFIIYVSFMFVIKFDSQLF